MSTFKVQFRKLRGEVIAVFPYEIQGHSTVLSYQHIGQHGEAAWFINKFTKRANPSEYEELLQELIRVYSPDILHIIKRRNHSEYLRAYKAAFKARAIK